MKTGIFVGLIPLLLSLCGLLNTPPEEVTSARMPSIDNVERIVIYDNWTGLSPLAPIIAEFDLTNAGTFFTGNAHFEVAGYSQNTPDTADETVDVPNDVMQQFLDKLNEAPLEEGEYIPNIQWTDDYPDLRIEIYSLSHEGITFQSQSQGDDHSPWGATFEGVDYVVNSGIPMEALDILRPYLHYETLENMLSAGG